MFCCDTAGVIRSKVKITQGLDRFGGITLDPSPVFCYLQFILCMYCICAQSRCKLPQVFNFHLVCDPTIRQPGFDLPRQQWSLLNRFRTEQGHWQLTDTDLCPYGETQTMSHIVESCPVTKLNGGLSWLHAVDEDAVLWLAGYGSWHSYEKKMYTLDVHLLQYMPATFR